MTRFARLSLPRPCRIRVVSSAGAGGTDGKALHIVRSPEHRQFDFWVGEWDVDTGRQASGAQLDHA